MRLQVILDSSGLSFRPPGFSTYGGWEERRIQGLGRSCDDRLFLIVGMGENELVKEEQGTGTAEYLKTCHECMVRSLSIIYLLSVSSVLSFFLLLPPVRTVYVIHKFDSLHSVTF